MSKFGARQRKVATWVASIYFCYSLCLSAFLSHRRMLIPDEFLAWNLISDASWRHALQSWNRAADSGGPLFYLISRGIVRVAGMHPLAIRMYSAACLASAGVLWSRLLRRWFTTIPAAFCVGMVWLCSPIYLEHLAEVRFYGQLVLAAAVAVTVAVWLEDKKPPTAACYFLSLGSGLSLVTTHMLGVVYCAAVVVSYLGSGLQKPQRLAAVAGLLTSWGSILFFLTAAHAGSESLNWIGSARFSNVIKHLLITPVQLTAYPHASMATNLLMLLCIMPVALSLLRAGNLFAGGARRQFVMLASCLFLAPLGFYVISVAYRPLTAARYLMPYSLGWAALVACGLNLLTRDQRWRRGQLPLTVAAVIVFVAVHVVTVREQLASFSPRSDLEPLLKLAEREPVVLEDDERVQQAHFYGDQRANQLFFLLNPTPATAHATLMNVSGQGYQPELVLASDFLQHKTRFLIVDTLEAKGNRLFELVSPSRWQVRPSGSVELRGAETPVYEVTRR